jgi:hypothetical protein
MMNFLYKQLQEKTVDHIKFLNSVPAKKGANQTAASAKSANFSLQF